jgi:hypothetical protein
LTGWQRAAQGWYPALSAATDSYPNSYTQMAPEEETKTIRSQIEQLEKNIRAAQERLGELESNQD